MILYNILLMLKKCKKYNSKKIEFFRLLKALNVDFFDGFVNNNAVGKDE
jgi:hypothetical protein